MSGQISPEITLRGYCVGIFPMGDEFGAIHWYSPDPRCILEFERFRVPRSVRRVIRRGVFEVRSDTAFDNVIAACADRPEGTWISPEITRTYRELHRRGYAHSVETWQGGKLAGGLYGVAIGGAFFGESMFHVVSDASKVALVAPMQHLQKRGFTLVDTQWSTPHLRMFGAIEIPQAEYLVRLGQALALPCRFGDRQESPTGA